MKHNIPPVVYSAPEIYRFHPHELFIGEALAWVAPDHQYALNIQHPRWHGVPTLPGYFVANAIISESTSWTARPVTIKRLLLLQIL